MPRKLPPPHPCACGCGGLTPRTFLRGHDTRIPPDTPCAYCGTRPAPFAIGRFPSCAAHLADAVRQAASGQGRATVRIRPHTHDQLRHYPDGDSIAVLPCDGGLACPDRPPPLSVR